MTHIGSVAWLLIGTMVTGVPIAAAQPASPEAAPTAADEIVVTASKRETRLSRTPLSVTAFSQGTLDQNQVRNVRDLKSLVPNLQIGTTADSGTAISIRGVASTDATEVAESAVSLHLDGFFLPRSQSALALMYDVERVEVLRGPQGTLYGMNSPAGTINIIPAKPKFGENSVKAEGLVGNYNALQGRAAVNIGVTDNLAIRISGMIDRHDGQLTQVQDFTDLAYAPAGIAADGIPDVDQRRNKPVKRSNWYNNAKQGGVRAIARWQPLERLEVQGTVSYFSDQGAGDIDYVDCGAAAGTVNACDHPLRYAKINVPGKKDLVVREYQLKVIANLTDHVTLEYRGGIQNEKRSQISDLDGGAHPIADWSSIGPTTPGTPADITQAYPLWDESTNTFASRYWSQTQELQLKSAGSGPFQWVAGAFLLHENKSIRYDDEIVENKTYQTDGNGNVIAYDGLPITTVYDQKKRTTTSKALFGQIDWRVVPKIGITLGARYSWDHKGDFGGVTYSNSGLDLNGNQIPLTIWYNGLYTPPTADGIRAHQSNNLTPDMGSGVPLGTTVVPISSPTNQTRDWKKATWKAGVQYYASDTHLLYALASTGYKMGGFYEDFDTCANGCLQLLQYDPETVTSYELGWKAKFFGGHLTGSLAGFIEEYDNMQQTGTFVVGTNQNPNSPQFGKYVETYTTVNLTNAEIKGVELEFGATPWRHGTFSGNINWLTATVSKSGPFIDGYARDARAIYGQTAIDDPGLTSLQGKHLPYAPDFTFLVNYRHDIALNGSYNLAPWVQVRYQSGMWLDIQNYSGAHLAQRQNAYAKIDANLRLTAPKDRWFVELWGENLTNHDSKNYDNYAYGRVRAYYDTPLTYGTRFGVQF